MLTYPQSLRLPDSSPPGGATQLSCTLTALHKLLHYTPCGWVPPTPDLLSAFLGAGEARGNSSAHAHFTELGKQLGTPAGDPRLCAAHLRATAPITVFPLPGGRVDDAKELVAGDGLGVQVHRDRLPLQVLVGLVERFEDLGKVRVTQDRAGE